MSASVLTMPDKLTTTPTDPRSAGAGLALALLLSINLFNYIDRQVLAAVEPEMQKELFPDSVQKDASAEAKATAEFWMGWLPSAFLVLYMVTAPLIGLLASRVSRWFLIGLGVIVWSIASGASGWDWRIGLGGAFWLVLLTRCFVGVGEGVYGPVAPAILSDLFSVKTRGQVLAWFYVAIPVGGALGFVLGEWMVGTAEAPGWGWRWAFFVVVPPGLLLGLLCFLMRDPHVGGADPSAKTVRKVQFSDYLVLLRTPSWVLNTVGMTGMTFALGGLAFWMAAYLEWREAPPLLGVGPKTVFGAITVLAGLLGTLSGGWAGDALRTRFSGSYFLVSGVVMLLGFPMILLFLWTTFPAAWLFVFLAVFCLFFNTGPTNTILANVVHPALRSTGFAFNILIIHLFGDILSPPLMGFVNGWYDRNVSFMVVSVAFLVGGAFWLWGAVYLQRDTELAATRIAAHE
jgi:MFS family permease